MPPLALRLLDPSSGAPGDPGLLHQVLRGAGLTRGPPRIRCPRCGWRPERRSRWSCTLPGCGTTWNTFETHGRCPGCDHQWTRTQCLACRRFAPHEDWYERGEPAGA